ncbi:hypothetical protein E2C01_064672 [Portunus trituberculatus]|uniref:Uncharacterized protein n=1 Tax=Portunus trituberculatus TaxID=210409 RepID=A0A5B7HJR9_PORTR|nr:hypothetical protein [Portunus trituberculatus]
MGDLKVEGGGRMVNGGGDLIVKDGESNDAHETDSGIHSGDDVVDRGCGGETGRGRRARQREPHREGDVETVMDGAVEEQAENEERQEDKSWEEMSFSTKEADDLKVIDLDQDALGHRRQLKNFDRNYSGDRRVSPRYGYVDTSDKDSDAEGALTDGLVAASARDRWDASPECYKVSTDRAVYGRESESPDTDITVLMLDHSRSGSERGLDAKYSLPPDPEDDAATPASNVSPVSSPVHGDGAESPMPDHRESTWSQAYGTNPEIRIRKDSSDWNESRTPSPPSGEGSRSPDNSSADGRYSVNKKFVSKSLSEGTIQSDPTRGRVFPSLGENRGSCRGAQCRLDIQEELPEDVEDGGERDNRDTKSRGRRERRGEEWQMKDTLMVPGERPTRRGLGRLGITYDDALSLSSPSSPEDEESRRFSHSSAELTPPQERFLATCTRSARLCRDALWAAVVVAV